SFFAVRRELAAPWPSDLASDFRSALESARRGLRAVSEPRARASYRAPDDPRAEWQRKVRTVRRGIAVLAAYRDLLHPRHGRDVGADTAMSARASGLGRLAPGGSPISGRALRRVFSADDAERELCEDLADRLGAVGVTLHASGREALRVALRALADRSGRRE